MKGNELIVLTKSVSETQKLAEGLAQFLQAGDVISLTGDLGAGKTCFVKGLAHGLRINMKITSPTFALIKEYMSLSNLPFYHFDVYRLKSLQEMLDIGYEEYFFGDGITVIEWGDKVAPLLPKDFLEIKFRRLLEENIREIDIIPHGGRWKKIAKKWLKESRKDCRSGKSTSEI
ncbi:tRNA (adenosine(37)-N6)-threonylcarbamoyltransferase complex ATPase subunit type 1 TsaE [Candidatus Oleimmundimicrobium sp.]|uniref:tRNA (adenosine(37)-N6)-threonylcarbamoyltransferase complex ATPase subunit type 1 TsaE n=1 Tax=Candidatus Oleimmundimicrobium sp. TaxID=3060597 RepID=UPI00272066B0|nr:tRNA (adenosine(37)-N6)-threonylcarbamoyltransferase complex ATPase subunit type 1 TsaE [Candidatus Oleimmundimicrobium sp.]MDO8886011.1 tRNA (adenosine(37)-N6)-threonylcarbamoyltransferase complex ATPase subunit type 1 TsaE [Candidatus Oleimmundimicrobium sp.]